MKKSKKHQFSHPDPEKKTEKESFNGGPKVKTNNRNDNVPTFVYRDLKRTGIIISSFILMVILLYAVQMKTSLLTPVLKKFGL